MAVEMSSEDARWLEEWRRDLLLCAGGHPDDDGKLYFMIEDLKYEQMNWLWPDEPSEYDLMMARAISDIIEEARSKRATATIRWENWKRRMSE